MKVQHGSIEEIRPYEANPRRNEAAVDAVAESIRQFGFRQPIACPSKFRPTAHGVARRERQNGPEARRGPALGEHPPGPPKPYSGASRPAIEG